jgi:hypothetical protein
VRGSPWIYMQYTSLMKPWCPLTIGRATRP